MLAGQAWAKNNYDFSAVCSTGQTLYYKIISDTEPYTVAVTCPNKTRNCVNLYKGYTKPSDDLVIPEVVTHNGKIYSVKRINEKAFMECIDLTSVIVPNSVDSIGEWAFGYCAKLTTAKLPDSISHISNCLFYHNNSLKILNIPTAVTSIGDFSFCGCSSLTSITIPESVTNIGGYAFEYCKKLTSITIPKSVTKIGFDAFTGCSNLTSVIIPEYNDYCGIPLYIDNIYYKIINKDTVAVVNRADNSRLLLSAEGRNSYSGNVIIPEKITAGNTYCVAWIYNYAFEECDNLYSVTIPNTVEYIDNDAFTDSKSLKEIKVASDNAKYSSEDGVLFNKDKTTLISYPSGRTGTYTIPNTITNIVGNAFLYSNLTSITIPKSVKMIDKYAFGGINNLTIYCEVNTKPKDWSKNWNKKWNGKCPVVWGKTE